MNYLKTSLKQELIIKKMVTVHYFEYAKNYVYTGEKHNFWEIVYVDKGEVEVMADTEGYRLMQGDMIFHKPNEFHNIWANGKIAPNFIVISFECLSKSMDFFKNKIIKIDNKEKNLLIQIIKESKEAFSSPLNAEYEKLAKVADSLFGCEQLIKTYIEQLLIFLVRKGMHVEAGNRLSSSAKERTTNDLTEKIKEYLDQNKMRNLTFKDICRFSRLSSSSLKFIFKEKTGQSVMSYFRDLKIEEAKRMLREEEYNITGISERLGYASIHTFSRCFKNVTCMSPNEYAKSIKSMI